MRLLLPLTSLLWTQLHILAYLIAQQWLLLVTLLVGILATGSIGGLQRVQSSVRQVDVIVACLLDFASFALLLLLLSIFL